MGLHVQLVLPSDIMILPVRDVYVRIPPIPMVHFASHAHQNAHNALHIQYVPGAITPPSVYSTRIVAVSVVVNSIPFLIQLHVLAVIIHVQHVPQVLFA